MNLQPIDYKSIALPIELHQHLFLLKGWAGLVKPILNDCQYPQLMQSIFKYKFCGDLDGIRTQSLTGFQIARFEIFETNVSESEELFRRYGGPCTKSLLGCIIILATWMGFEPTTSAVTGRHSNQLNYQASSTFYYKITKCNEQYLIAFGGSNRARTCDPLLVRQMLSQLSYTSIW